MEPIDVGADRFSSILADVAEYRGTIHSEQDTRLKVINRVLQEALGWPLSEISTEERSGSGFIDYKLSVGGHARLIVEAKRDDRSLGISGRGGGRTYKLKGPVFATESMKEGIDQAIRYCGQKNAELACVTNGHEWVVFRGSRLGDGIDTLEGIGFVFPTLEDVREQFARYYDLLSYESASKFRYRALFQEAEGRPVRAHHFRKALRDPNSKRALRHDRLSADLDRVMTSFFRRLSGDDDPQLLANCFVVTRESQIADERLARISEDLLGRIRSLDTASGSQLTAVVERVQETQRNEFVLLVGTKGAGKSTFIDRFFRYVLPERLRRECMVARINVADSSGDEAIVAAWLDQRLLQELESEVFGDTGPSFGEIKGMFFDEYQRLSTGAWKPLYTRDKEEFDLDFGRHIERRREERPHEYIQRLVRHISALRRKIPCLIFDNADHFTIEFQERVFQYARSIYERALCLVIMPITDRTSWQLSREGALRSFESESLYLPTPPPRMVLRRRIEYLEAKLAEERRQPGRGYFLSRGIPLSIDNLTAFAAALQAVFLRDGLVSLWIGSLANNDIRRCLEIAHSVIASPHLEVHQLISAYVTGSNIEVPLARIKRALIKQQYDIFPGEINKYVWNVYALDEEVETSPLLGLRLLQLLDDARRSDSEDPFISLGQVVDYCRAMQIHDSATLSWLSRMLDGGLCLSYDPTVTAIANVAKIELAPAGYQHLLWGKRDGVYIEAMLEVTPIVDQETFEQIRSLTFEAPRDRWRGQFEMFVKYLTAEDEKYCKVQNHEAFASQGRVSEELLRASDRKRRIPATMPNRTSEHHGLRSSDRRRRRRRPNRQRAAPAAPTRS